MTLLGATNEKIPVPVSPGTSVSLRELRQLAGIGNQFDFVRSGDTPTSINDQDVIAPDEVLHLVPHHIPG